MKSPLNLPSKLQQKSWQKVFINYIPQSLPNQILFKLMNVFGNVKQIKRTTNSRGTLQHFAFINYQTVQQVLRAQRILNNYKLLDSTLHLRSSDETEMVLKQWLSIQSQQYKHLKQVGHKDAKQFTDFDKFIRRQDKQCQQKLKKVIVEIQNEYKKITQTRNKEEQKKIHQRQLQREMRKKQQKRDLQKKFKQKLEGWKKLEEEKERDYIKEKQREIQRARKKQKLIQKQLNIDTDQQIRRIKKFRDHQRKKMMIKQQEQDQKALIKQQQQRKNQLFLNPPQPQQPLQQIYPQPPAQPQQKKTFSIIQTKQLNRNKTYMQREGNFQQDIIVKKKIIKQQQQYIEPAFLVTDEKTSTLVKKSIPISIPKRKNSQQQKKQKQQAQKKQAQYKKKLAQLMKLVPKQKNQLFNWKIDWPSIAKNNILQKKIRPWLIKKSIQYIGQQSDKFVMVIQKKLINKCSPLKILEKITDLLKQESQQFVIKLWKQLIFQLIKLQHGI